MLKQYLTRTNDYNKLGKLNSGPKMPRSGLNTLY